MAPKGAKKAKLSEGRSLAKPSKDRSDSESGSDVPVNQQASAGSSSESESESEDEVFEDKEGLSSSESASESEEAKNDAEDDAEDDATNTRDAKPARKGDGFGTALDAILGSRVKAHDAADPILIRNKRTSKEIEEAKAEARARRALRAEKQQFKDRAHNPDLVPKDVDAAGEAMQHEKALRRTAQRGVVKLMNAIHNAQVAAQTTDGTSKQAAAKQDEISKEKFLDMIRMG